MLIFLALEMVGVALAENAVYDDMVNNSTMDLVTKVQGYIYTADQSVSVTGFANINSNLASVNPNDGSEVLNPRPLFKSYQLLFLCLLCYQACS